MATREDIDVEPEKVLNMQEATCPICDDRFEYPKGGFRPMTCEKPDCKKKFKEE